MEPEYLPHLILSLVTGKLKWMRLVNHLPSFTVSPLGFYEYEHMQFGLTNAP